MATETINMDNGIPASPRVSVVMCAYNAITFLRLAIQSVLDQTFDNFELIVVNDGSTDGTLEMLKQFAEADGRVKVISQENTGIPKAANAGLAASRAEYIARFDSDDVMLPSRLDKQITFMDAHPEVVASGTATQLIDEQGRYITTWYHPRHNDELQDKLERAHCSISQPAMIMRAKPVQELGGYDEDFAMAEDLDLFLRLGEIGELANMPEALTQYRLHNKSISESRIKESRELGREAWRRAMKRRGKDTPFEAGDAWRPDGSRAGRFKFALKYAWCAYHAAEYNTARHYAVKALKAKPGSAEAWKLLLRSLSQKGGGRDLTPPPGYETA